MLHLSRQTTSASPELVDALASRLAPEVARLVVDLLREALAEDRKAADAGNVLLSSREVAERLALSERTVRTLVADGQLPSLLVRGARRVRLADLNAFVAARLNDERAS